MKPSDEIKNKMGELMAKDGKDPNNGLITYYEMAILDYLDEEWSKNQEKQDEEKVCPKCGFSGQIDPNTNLCWSSECKGK